MKRKSIKIVLDIQTILLLHEQFEYSASLVGTNLQTNEYSKYQSIHGFGALDTIIENSGNAFQTLQLTIDQKNDFLFGCLGYDLKNEIEDITSNNLDLNELPDMFFFQPKFVVTEEKNNFILHYFDDKETFLNLIDSNQYQVSNKNIKIDLTPRISKSDYFKQFEVIHENIQLGNIYEMNYCQEFYQENCELEPITIFQKMISKAKAPFMVFLKMKSNYLISASPERYLQKSGQKLVSQPIKGTAKRGKNRLEDEKNKQALQQNLKEKTENVMIVDLVRNDLGKCCTPGSVTVSEFQKIYTYPTVHQLISTVEGEMKIEFSITDVLKNTFPMGSMTGAPKLKVLKLTEQVEATKRGWYSGAVGYILPNQDFDFNVIIRTLLYNHESKYLSCSVGGGITAAANAEDEYQECLLKLNSLIDLIND